MEMGSSICLVMVGQLNPRYEYWAS